MAQTVTIQTAGIFADSTEVKAYPTNQVPDKRRAPIGAATASATTASGTATVAGLADNTQYLIGAEVSSKWLYVAVTTPKAGAAGAMTQVVAANTITLPGGVGVVEITGTTEIKKITAAGAGERVSLKFKESVKVVAGENLKLASGTTIEATSDDVLNLICDGTNWLAAGFSVNP